MNAGACADVRKSKIHFPNINTTHNNSRRIEAGSDRKRQTPPRWSVSTREL
jgi:hypothetical protein